MSAQVIYLNRFYYPDEEERKRLDSHQEFLTFCHIEFDQAHRYLLPKDLKLKKEAIYKRARQRIGIVKMVDE